MSKIMLKSATVIVTIDRHNQDKKRKQEGLLLEFKMNPEGFIEGIVTFEDGSISSHLLYNIKLKTPTFVKDE